MAKTGKIIRIIETPLRPQKPQRVEPIEFPVKEPIKKPVEVDNG